MFKIAIVLKQTKPSWMNIPKRDLCLFMLHEFKLGHDASQTSTNINSTWGEGSKCNWTVRKRFQKFRSENKNLDDEKIRGRVCIFDNKQLIASSCWAKSL